MKGEFLVANIKGQHVGLLVVLAPGINIVKRLNFFNDDSINGLQSSYINI